MSHQMRSHQFDGTDPIRIFKLLKQFCMTWILTLIQEGDTAYILPFFLTVSVHEQVNDQLATRARRVKDGSGAPPSGGTYPELVQFLLIR